MATQFLQLTGAVRIRDKALSGATADIVAVRIAKLKAAYERMRKINSLVRKRNVKGLKRFGYSEAQISRLLQLENEKRSSIYPDFKLRNSYRKIVALRRLARLLDTTDRQDVAIEEESYSYHEDVAAQQIRYRFAAKPDKAIRALLRRAGFELRPSRNAYERNLDEDGIAVLRSCERI